MNALDLFCGCGGLSHGLSMSGINVVAGIDCWDKAIESYKKNHNHTALCRDLTTYPPERFEKHHNKGRTIDILVGGCPCQGFSMAGRRDKNDPRNSLFNEYVKYLDFYKPKVFVFENVMGILSMKLQNDKKAIDIIMEELSKNYNCHINKLYASDFDVPQNRRRVIIIGVRKDLNIIPTNIPIITENRIPVKTVLENREIVNKKYYLSQKALDGIKNKREKMKEKSYGFGAQFLDFDKPSFTIPSRYWKDGYDALVKYDDTHIRRLTELELKRIQSFDDDYIILGNKKDVIIQIGNAVPPKLAYHIGNYLTELLDVKN